MSKYEYKVFNGYHLLVSASAIEKQVDQQPDKKLTDVTYEDVYKRQPYERVSVSFTLPENAEPKVYCMAYCDMADGFAGGN